ncbi:MAG: branched-chain amino acid ABC transporter permease, partial [Actinobacteria bacterium]|nr:branched-chain amino acid ABC transporter permease [Actinomycetota bacterium]
MIGKNKKINYGLIFLVLPIFIPLILKSEYQLRVINMVLLYSIVALSINLIVGFGGILDFGRSAFVGIGAYWSAIMTVHFDLPFFIAFISAGIVCALSGFILGMLCRRSSFDYLTLITIGFNVMCAQIFLNWRSVTGGAMGIRLVPPPILFGFKFDTNLRFFYFTLFLLIICYILIKRITESKIGRAFEAVRDDPIAAACSGINIANFKVINFSVASFFTGIAGSAMAHYTNYISPFTITLDESIYQLQMAILGGLGSLPGSILGAFILVVLPEISRTFYEYRLMFLGFIMVGMMIWSPNGILGRDGIGEKVIGMQNFI